MHQFASPAFRLSGIISLQFTWFPDFLQFFLGVTGGPHLVPDLDQLLRAVVAVGGQHVLVALWAEEGRLVEVEFLRVERLDAGLERHDAEVDVVEAG